jgi:hypothetical protein
VAAADTERESQMITRDECEGRRDHEAEGVAPFVEWPKQETEEGC